MSVFMLVCLCDCVISMYFFVNCDTLLRVCACTCVCACMRACVCVDECMCGAVHWRRPQQDRHVALHCIDLNLLLSTSFVKASILVHINAGKFADLSDLHSN